MAHCSLYFIGPNYLFLLRSLHLNMTAHCGACLSEDTDEQWSCRFSREFGASLIGKLDLRSFIGASEARNYGPPREQ